MTYGDEEESPTQAAKHSSSPHYCEQEPPELDLGSQQYPPAHNPPHILAKLYT